MLFRNCISIKQWFNAMKHRLRLLKSLTMVSKEVGYRVLFYTANHCEDDYIIAEM